MKDTIVLLASAVAALFAQTPTPFTNDPLFDRLVNLGGMTVVAGVSLFLLKNAIKDFRDSLESQRKSHMDAMSQQRAEWDRERSEYVAILKQRLHPTVKDESP